MSILQPRGIRTLNQHTRNLVLSVIEGPKKGLRVVVPPGESRVVGRNTSAHVACEDDYMSSKHFEVCNRIENFFVRDLNSRNGTKVFDEAISERSFNETSRISAGKSIIEVSWEASHEEWGTQAGSSVWSRRGSSQMLSASPHRPHSHDSVYGSSPGSQSHFDSRMIPTNLSVYSTLEERISAICLDLFHASVFAKREATVGGLERLYNWSRVPSPNESFLSDFYLANLDFFAIASFSKIGVENPASVAWYPIYPSVDPASKVSPIAIPKKAWMENCHTRWFERLSAVDGISFVITDSLTNPERLLSLINFGFRELLSPNAREEANTIGMGSSDNGCAVVPWYSPMELLATVGTQSDENLARWIPPSVLGLVFTVRSSKLSFAYVRPPAAASLRERGFRAASDP